MTSYNSLFEQAESLADVLRDRQLRLVLAESCTAGLVAAALGRIAGISEYFCGSAVTYRNDTKQRWLSVSTEVLQGQGPVSEAVACQMAQGVLESTPEADCSAAVTGHVGPGAPVDADGLIFVAVARRNAGAPVVTRIQLAARHRIERQAEAASWVLRCLSREVAR